MGFEVVHMEQAVSSGFASINWQAHRLLITRYKIQFQDEINAAL
jgi:hypothetical protein